MLATQRTNFCTKQTLQGQKYTLELECGDLLIFKGDFVHSGGASSVTNFRFFSYCPTQATPPVWWNRHKDEKDILPVTSKLTEARVGKLNLRIVTNPQSSKFSPADYKKYLYCDKTNSFFPFDMSAYFHGIHTHKQHDSVAYDGMFEKLRSVGTVYKTVSKHCIHYPSNQQLLEDFPKLGLPLVTHWRTKCECSRVRVKKRRRLTKSEEKADAKTKEDSKRGRQ